MDHFYGFARRSIAQSVWTNMAMFWGTIVAIVGIVGLCCGMPPLWAGGLVLLGTALFCTGVVVRKTRQSRGIRTPGILYSNGSIHCGDFTIHDPTGPASGLLRIVPGTNVVKKDAAASKPILRIVVDGHNGHDDQIDVASLHLSMDGSPPYEMKAGVLGREGYIYLIRANKSAAYAAYMKNSQSMDHVGNFLNGLAEMMHRGEFPMLNVDIKMKLQPSQFEQIVRSLALPVGGMVGGVVGAATGNVFIGYGIMDMVTEDLSSFRAQQKKHIQTVLTSGTCFSREIGEKLSQNIDQLGWTIKLTK